MGTGESTPVSYRWRWHYYLPSLALWTLIAALAVLTRGSRNRRGWPVFLLAGLMIVLVQIEGLGILLVSAVIVWIAAWRLHDRLAGGDRSGELPSRDQPYEAGGQFSTGG